MSLLRQGGSFLAVGLAQLLLDWGVFVSVSALGVPPGAANVVGRISGALLGFWLNGRFTFRGEEGARLGWARLRRFGLTWLLLTVASTLLVGWLAGRFGLQLAWLAKPVVEGVLAIVSFVLLRQVVYR